MNEINNSSRIIESYIYPHFANKSKISKIIEVLKEYRNTAYKIGNFHWKYFFTNNGKLNKNIKLSSIESKPQKDTNKHALTRLSQ